MRKFLSVLALIILTATGVFGQARTAERLQTSAFSALDTGSPPIGSVRYCINCRRQNGPCVAASVGETPIGSDALKTPDGWMCTSRAAGAGSATVSSVSAGNLSPLFTTSVATATTTPAISFTLSSQAIKTFLAGPASGSAAPPTFRGIVPGDFITGSVTASRCLRTDGSGNIVVAAADCGTGGGTWGSITGTLSSQTDLQAALDLKAPLASPTFTGVPAAPTAAVDTNTTQIATTGYVIGQGYAKLASPTFTGTVTIPTPFTLGAVSVLPTGTELNFVDGVTSSIQTQLDAKQPLDSDLTTLAGLTATTNNFIVGVASAWASRTPTQVKTTLSLDNVDNTSDATKNAAAVTLTNKTISGASNTITNVSLATGVTGDLPFASFTPATAASKLLGRGSAAGAGDFEEITIGSGLTMTGTTLSASAGSGDVVGPASATDNAITRFDGTTGKLVQNSGVTITDGSVVQIGGTSASFPALRPSAGNLEIIKSDLSAFTYVKPLGVRDSLDQAGLDGSGVGLGTPSAILFSSDATWYGTKDVGMRRNAAGVIEVYDGVTGGVFRDLKARGIIFPGSTSGNTTLNASAVAGTTTLTLPAATDTLVGRATTDTLTNKTLTSPVINTPTGIAFSDLSGSVTDAQVPNNITVDLATTATTANAGDSATAFFSSGTLETGIGGTGNGTPAEDQLLVGNGTTFQLKTLPSCSDGVTSKLLYNTTTNTFTCGADQTTGGGSGITTLNTLTAATQTFSKTDDTNVTLTLTSASADHNFALGWTGTLAKARQHAATVYTDQANTYTSGLQDFSAVTNFVGALRRKRTATAINYTVLTTDGYVGVTDTSAARTITLPDLGTADAGFEVTIADESNGAMANPISIVAGGSDTFIAGITGPVVIDLNQGSVTLMWLGTSATAGWRIK